MRGKWLAVAGLMVAGAAWGESTSMTGKFPTGVREAGRLGVVAVDLREWIARRGPDRR